MDSIMNYKRAIKRQTFQLKKKTKDINKYFLEERNWPASQDVKRWSPLLVTGKLCLRGWFPYMSGRGMLKNYDNNYCWAGCGETLTCCWQVCKSVHALWRVIWQCQEKLKLCRYAEPMWQEFSPGCTSIYTHTLEKASTCTQQYIGTRELITVMFIIAKLWKHVQYPSTCKWINKLYFIYLTEYCSSVKTINLDLHIST